MLFAQQAAEFLLEGIDMFEGRLRIEIAFEPVLLFGREIILIAPHQ
jgi:hypothetical protein